MAKSVKKAARNFMFLFRLAGFILIFTMLWPLAKVLHLGNGNGGLKNGNGKKHRAQDVGEDSLFAPLAEKVFIKKARADIPPH